MNEAPAVSIGRVTELLKEEFPDLTPSKIRFLESRGMIHPARSSAGYRQFGPADIRRIRFILQRQRDHFLPLKVIKSQLAEWEQGVARDLDHAEAEQPDRDPVPDAVFLDLQELAGRANLSRTQLRRLIAHNLIEPHDEDGRSVFTGHDLAIADQCRILMDGGLEPRHLRLVRNAVSRHVDLIGELNLIRQRHRGSAARRQAVEATERGVDALRRLSDLLFVTELRTILDED